MLGFVVVVVVVVSAAGAGAGAGARSENPANGFGAAGAFSAASAGDPPVAVVVPPPPPPPPPVGRLARTIFLADRSPPDAGVAASTGSPAFLLPSYFFPFISAASCSFSRSIASSRSRAILCASTCRFASCAGEAIGQSNVLPVKRTLKGERG